MITPAEQRRSVSTIITSLQSKNFYGEVVIKLQGGSIVYVTVQQGFKIEDVHQTIDQAEGSKPSSPE